MINERLKKAVSDILKDLLSKCTTDQQMMFKRMYSHNNLELDINTVVDNMCKIPKNTSTADVLWRLNHAIFQCEKTVSNNEINHFR